MTVKQKRILKRKMKRIKEKAGEIMVGIGFMGFLIFASAVDGPGNDMAMVYGGLIVNMAMMGAGSMMMGEVDI